MKESPRTSLKYAKDELLKSLQEIKAKKNNEYSTLHNSLHSASRSFSLNESNFPTQISNLDETVHPDLGTGSQSKK